MSYHTQANEALRLARERRHPEAIPWLRKVIQEVSVADEEYDTWLLALAGSLRATGGHESAGHIHLYLLDFNAAHDAFTAADSPLDRALCCERRGQHEEASDLYLGQRRTAHAAAALEEVSPARALPLWQRLVGELDPTQEPYAYALAVLNMAHCQGRVEPGCQAMRRGLIESLGYLEGLACEYEQQGLTDEALDCYHMIIQIGQEQHAFENLSEGYINAIRLLTERGRTLTALRYYAGVSKEGKAWGEHHAVATLLQEAAEMVLRAGMLYGNYYIERAGEAWLEVVRTHTERGMPAELTENATLAALDCFNRLDDVARIQSCYETLSALPIGDGKTRRYRRLFESVQREHRDAAEIHPPSELLLRPPRLIPLWREDLLMWEEGSEPTRMITRAVWDLVYHDTVRRRALNLVLFLLDADASPEQARRLQLETARALAFMLPKQAFRGLKRLLRHDDAEVRAEVMRAAGELDHPSGLMLIEEGLAQTDPVRAAALEAIERHHRAEDFDGLRRLFERFDAIDVRRRVLTAIGKIRTFEVAEYLYRMLLSGTPSEMMTEAQKSLERVLSPEWRRILKHRVETEPEGARQRLSMLL